VINPLICAQREPGGHPKHALAAKSENVPLSQSWHWLALPTENVPGVHLMGIVELRLQTFPAGQGEQKVPLQLEMVPRGQSIHSMAPVLAVNFPTGHFVGEDVPFNGQEKPTGQGKH
jgi:hypothetical protein